MSGEGGFKAEAFCDDCVCGATTCARAEPAQPHPEHVAAPILDHVPSDDQSEAA